MIRNKNQRLSRILLIIAILGTFFTWKTLLKSGYFSMHDDMQAFRVLEVDKCFHDGQIPCRWIPDGGYGYGYPLFNYYPPLPYYLAELIHFFGFSIIDSVKIVFGLGFVVAAAMMFLLGEALWGSWGGLLSSFFYTYAPYHSLDIYVRGAMNEFWSLAFFPAIFWAIFKFIQTEKRKYLFYFSFFYTLLFLSHNLMVLIFTPTAVVWLLLNLLLKKKLKLVIRFILPSLLVVGMSAFFFLPVVFEKNLVHIETMFMGYFNYLAHFVSLRQLFFRRNWGYGASVWGEDEKISFQIGFWHWGLAFLISLLAAFVSKTKAEKKSFWRIFFLLFMGLGAAFFTHSRSNFFWKTFKSLEYLQFPWRFLTLVIFAFSLLSGAIIIFLRKFFKNKLLLSVIILMLCFAVIIFNVGYFKEEVWYQGLTDQEKFSDPKEWQEQVTSGIFDYLPKSAKFPPAEAAPSQPWLLNGEGQVKDVQKGTDWLKFNLVLSSDSGKIRLPIYYFPNWTIWLDKQKISFDYQNDLGLPTITASKGDHQITARLENTPIRKIGNWLSLLCWSIWLLAMIKYNHGRKTTSIRDRLSPG